MRNYAVVIHQDPERGYWAEVPALPVCYSQGESVEELMANIREAIAGVLGRGRLDFRITPARNGSGVRDTSVRHDRYLAGK